VYFALSSGEALMRGRHSEKSFPCFASQGQKQGKTELFMVADLQEMQENQRVSEIRVDKSEFMKVQIYDKVLC
jgi:hypothetical protein